MLGLRSRFHENLTDTVYWGIMGVHQCYFFIQRIFLFNECCNVRKLKFVKHHFVSKFAPPEEHKAS